MCKSKLKLEDLDYYYPPDLVALKPSRPSRVMWVDAQGRPQELTVEDVLERVMPGDAFVINQTRVLKRRVFDLDYGIEILFLNPLRQDDSSLWHVLTPSSRWPTPRLRLPGSITVELIEGGNIPQIVRVEGNLSDSYFDTYGQVPLPPYILKELRILGQEHEKWYQAAWAKVGGSVAAPTASLHFSLSDLVTLRMKGVWVVPLILHVGWGTFAPIQTPEIHQQTLHQEWVFIPALSWNVIQTVKARGARIWALGTTVARALESAYRGLLKTHLHGLEGWTDLFIYPPFQWMAVDVLLTNFHQPRSSLLALVMAAQNRQTVLEAYAWAIQRRFRLFSYGDLSVWEIPDNLKRSPYEKT